MNKLALLVALALTTVSAMAAKSGVTIENASDLSMKPIYWLTSGTLAPKDSGTFIQVFGGPVNGVLAPLTDANGNAIIANMGDYSTSNPGGAYAADGQFYLGGGAVPGTTGGGAVDLQVKAWQGAATYDAAPFQGQSTIFTVNNTGIWPENAQVPIDGPGLMGFPGLTITAAIVPEPSTIALGLLGAATLLLRRRS